MIQQLLGMIPKDADNLLDNFFLGKEQELKGKIIIVISRKSPNQNSPKQIQATFFLKNEKGTSPIQNFKNLDAKAFLKMLMAGANPMVSMVLATVNVPALVEKGFASYEESANSDITFFIVNEEGKTLIKERHYNSEKTLLKEETKTITQMLEMLTNNKDDIADKISELF